MGLLSNKEINTSRQFEFDLAKAICIFGMVFVHCFEMIPLTQSAYEGSLYYVLEIVLDSLFGAGTFMVCLGIGLTYTKNNKPNDFIKRGFVIFGLGYLLNLFRYALPACLYYFTSDPIETTNYVFCCLFATDIMQFAGLALIFFGLLKKAKAPDWGIVIVALAMSVIGSFVRFIQFDSVWLNRMLGLFIGTKDDNNVYSFESPFPFLNWFIFVVFGYLFGKVIRKCENKDKFYAISTPISAVVIITYMVISIPNKLGMMCGEGIYYFQMTTLDALIIIMGAVFAFGLYHFISKLFNEKTKNFITNLAVNINKTYCIHWVILGWLSVFLFYFFEDSGIPNYIILLLSLVIYVVSSFIAELVKRRNDKKKAIKKAKQ